MVSSENINLSYYLVWCFSILTQHFRQHEVWTLTAMTCHCNMFFAFFPFSHSVVQFLIHDIVIHYYPVAWHSSGQALAFRHIDSHLTLNTFGIQRKSWLTRWDTYVARLQKKPKSSKQQKVPPFDLPRFFSIAKCLNEYLVHRLLQNVVINLNG